MSNWFLETFNSSPSEGDVIKTRSLNITRMAGVVVPVLAGISLALGEVAEQPPFDNVDFQRQLILAMIALIGLVTIADIFGRAMVNRQADSAGIFTIPMPASKTESGEDTAGSVLGMRTNNGATQYLFLASIDGAETLGWVGSEAIKFTPGA